MHGERADAGSQGAREGVHTVQGAPADVAGGRANYFILILKEHAEQLESWSIQYFTQKLHRTQVLECATLGLATHQVGVDGGRKRHYES